MRLLIIGAAALALASCGTTGLPRNPDGTSQVLTNLEHCSRTYIGSIGGIVPAAVSVSITCEPRPYDKAPPAKPDPELVNPAADAR